MKKIHTWKGKPIDKLSRKELIEAVNFLVHEMEALREERNAWMKRVAQFNICFKKTKERSNRLAT